ncbi:DUF3634 family protein [Vibrio sp. SCSIO 43137]|uniref:DUF3634 family protein n=1 Tax=Vibrio sp. SCSIO 43137 TaxID=3021011 RepID=UPI0023082F4D|nr:DUF3634 family protein [Vibrio sp. SCSIO 43137]WCE31097.1 DUF3634 family protein [Vibrio sp. SCSIO 43137]
MMYVIIAGALVIFWLVAIDRPVLKMEFKDGELIKHKGNMPHGFSHNCREIGHKTPFSGTVKVYMTRSGPKLKFSKGISNKIQQRIRNVFPHQGFTSKGNKKAR